MTFLTVGYLSRADGEGWYPENVRVFSKEVKRYFVLAAFRAFAFYWLVRKGEFLLTGSVDDHRFWN